MIILNRNIASTMTQKESFCVGGIAFGGYLIGSGAKSENIPCTITGLIILGVSVSYLIDDKNTQFKEKLNAIDVANENLVSFQEYYYSINQTNKPEINS